MHTKSENRLVNGVVFLAIAGILVKVLGLICKIPLVNIIGEDGMGYYNAAYTIYNLFFILSNAGLPVAVSILISEQTAKGCLQNVRKVFLAVMVSAFAVGIAGCLILGFGSAKLANLVASPRAGICILTMAPVFLFVCIAGVLRGYFQGRDNLMPTGISQLIEALFKALAGVCLAMYGVHRNLPVPVCASFALVGIALGSFLSMMYLFLRMRRDFPRAPKVRKYSVSVRYIVKRLAWIAFPITLGSLVLSLANFVDLAAIMRGLAHMGLDMESANRLYGNYTGLVVPLFNMPPVLVMPIACAVVPVLTKAKWEGQRGKVISLSDGALKASALITLPCVFGLLALSKPILLLLFERQAALRAAPLLSLLAPAVFFLGIVTVTNSLLQAMGKQYLPVVSMLLGGICKVLISYLLIPRIGIKAAPIGTLGCYVVIALVNLYFTYRHIGLDFRIWCRLRAPLMAAFLASLGGKTAYQMMVGAAGIRLSALISIFMTAVLYLWLLLILRCVGPEELSTLPLPDKLKKLLCRILTRKERTHRNEKSRRIKEREELRL